MVDTGGQQRHPASTEALMRYWTEGPGAAKIRWGEKDDFYRCVANIQAAITKGGSKPLPDNEIKGLCAKLHHRATGTWPGDHDGDGHRDKPGDGHRG